MKRPPDKPVDLERVRAADARLAALREKDPEAFAAAADRGAAWCRGELAGPTLNEENDMSYSQTPVNIRLPDPMVQRADRLLPILRDRSDLATAIRVTRSDVLRLAILRGLDQLEAEYDAHPTLPGV